MPVGAEAQPDGGVHFRVWAPDHRRVEVVLEGPEPCVALPLIAEPPGAAPPADEEYGYFSAFVEAAAAGTRYRYRLDDDAALYPDPASRYQPDGPHGPSVVVDPVAFPWTDHAWGGAALSGQVIYEMHIGTFTPEGTWAAATGQLAELAGVGITVLELMPFVEFAGRFGWGYDGVDLFAPTRLYGEPDDVRRFVDRAHAHGLAVIVDVVYNHLGPDGNYLPAFAKGYFTDKYETDWGAAVHFDGPGCGPVREFFIANAGYWIDEFHCDGLRIDATQAIFDASPVHILTEIGRRARVAARGRQTIIVAENEPQDTDLIRPVDKGGNGFDGLWNDDFHHAAMVALTGRNEAYYRDHLGMPQEFISTAKYGYHYQGQHYTWHGERRGKPSSGLPPAAFVTFIQNHDQLANSGQGLRAHVLTSPGLYRAMTALMLLMPGTPMLFQGQEFAASAPFLYFADHAPELTALVRKGRRETVAQFASGAQPDVQVRLDDPGSLTTFERCKLDFSERESHVEMYALHKDLLRLRRDDPPLAAQRPRGVDGAVLGPEAFVLRFFGRDWDAAYDESDDLLGDRLLIVNFGRDLDLSPAPEPLLAPPYGHRWAVRWSSEDPRYGGGGTPPPEGDKGRWHLLGRAAVVLAPEPEPTQTPKPAQAREAEAKPT